MSLNDSDQDPWGKPGSSGSKRHDENKSNHDEQPNKNSQNKDQQSPPDLEEIFNNLLRKLGKRGNGGSNNSGNEIKGLGKLLPIAAVIGAIVWGASGFYTVKEAERGVVLRFGELHSIVQPGLNWKPTFIDEVIPVNIERVKELRTQGAMLTQDENMVKVEMTVQYRVQDPAKYLFSVTNANDSLNQATDSALRYVIGHMTMDDILTTGRSIVRENTWQALNTIIAPYDMGLDVLDVNFQSARPPEEVKAAFDDAIKAQEDEQRYIREAEAYAREQEPRARGNAQRIIEKATAYKEQIVLNAQGEVERFQLLLPEFRAAPDLLKERLYIQTMEKVMANTPKVMLDGANGNNLTVLPLDQILSGKKNQMDKTKETDKNMNVETMSEVPRTFAPSYNNDNSENFIIETVPMPESKKSSSDSLGRQGRFN